MVKVIRFPLEMEDGIKVRTLEELKENFSIEKVMLSYINGKLLKWLIDRGYDTEAKKIKEIDKINEEDISKYICNIFEVKYNNKMNLDIKNLRNRENKINTLKKCIKDESIIEKVDNIAFNQEELLNILSKEENQIYLYNNTFEIPLNKENINYIGISDSIAKLKIDDISILNKKNIKFKDIVIKNNDKIIDINEINKRDIEVLVRKKDNKITLYGRDKISGEEFTITDSNENIIEDNGLEENLFISYNNKIFYFIEPDKLKEEIVEQYGLYNELIFRDLKSNSRIKVSTENIIFSGSYNILYLNEDYLVLKSNGCTYLFSCKKYELIKIAEEDKLFRGRENEIVFNNYFIYLKEGKIYIKDIVNKSERILNLPSDIYSLYPGKNYIYYIIKSSYRVVYTEYDFILCRINILDLKVEVLGKITEGKIGDSIAIYTRNDENILWGKVSNKLTIGIFNINMKESKKLNESLGDVLKNLREIKRLHFYWKKYFN